jgi:hypothetical protein
MQDAAGEQPGRLLAWGVLRLDSAAPSFVGGRAFIRLEDTTYADARATLLAEQIIADVNHTAGTAEEIPFALYGPAPSPEVRDASISAHVDVNGDGKINPGDLLSEESYPASLTKGNDMAVPSDIVVQVRLYQP